jgi:hypothetical protein
MDVATIFEACVMNHDFKLRNRLAGSSCAIELPYGAGKRNVYTPIERHFYVKLPAGLYCK